MELLEDVLVKEFSKKAIPYLGEWTQLKQSLYDKDECVINALRDYLREIDNLEEPLDTETFIIHLEKRDTCFKELLKVVF